MAEKKAYECRNKACSLGSLQQPGRFTGGMTKEGLTLLTGNQEPDKSEYGEGICPNCGQKGVPE